MSVLIAMKVVLVAATVVAGTGSAQTLSPGGPASAFSLSTFAGGLSQLTDFRFLPDGRVVITQKSGEVMVRRTDGTLVQAGSFRPDLFYRLHVVMIDMPPLRDRSEDIPLLVEHFVAKLCTSMNRQERPQVAQLLGVRRPVAALAGRQAAVGAKAVTSDRTPRSRRSPIGMVIACRK